MSSHSVAEARERLPELVERALRGEPVVSTRDGRPVQGIRQAGPVAPEALAWLDRFRVTAANGPGTDAETLIRRMRDEGP
jgi:antitoxin (DNA-binding transcriptional repressor) of toxin-antitoxin stability system